MKDIKSKMIETIENYINGIDVCPMCKHEDEENYEENCKQCAFWYSSKFEFKED